MNYYAILALCMLGYMSFWFIVSLIKKRNDIADVAWGLGFVLLSWMAVFLSGEIGNRTLLLCGTVSIWGLRLATHIYRRNRNKAEDYRYHQWRIEWGKWLVVRSLFQIYILQGALLFIIAFPVLMAIQTQDSPLGLLDITGFIIWIAGFYFETVGDAQLAAFKRNPANKGKLMQEGLWAYSRHPNYFGEVLLWWGIWLISFAASANMYTIIGPLTITFLILKVSGIPMLEEKMQEHPAFDGYKEKTSKFFPMPQRLQRKP